MLAPDTVARYRATLTSLASGYLRNPIRERGVTCVDCMTPVGGYAACYKCSGHQHADSRTDAIAIVTYAIAGRESGRVLRGYKAFPPVAEHRLVVGLMLALALTEHTTCLGQVTGHPVTHWTIVPSLPAKNGPHPLRDLVAEYTSGAEISLIAAADAKNPRSVSADHFACPARLPETSHVLVIDDTWASGGHVRSAVLALRHAGAAKVSVLVAARWIKENIRGNEQFLSRIAGQDFDTRTCPWTSVNCHGSLPHTASPRTT
jgi:hypothetical protein